MKLDFFLLADRVERDEDGKLFVQGGLITRISVYQLPTSIQLAAAVRLMIEEGDTEAEKPFELFLRFTRPAGGSFQSNVLLIDPSELALDVSDPEEERSAMVITDLSAGLPVEEAGLHRLQIILNGDVIAERRLVVEEPAEEAPQP